MITLGLVLAGCHSGGKTNQAAPSASTTSSPSPAPSVAAADAVAAYRGMWKAVVAGSTVPDPELDQLVVPSSLGGLALGVFQLTPPGAMITAWLAD